MSEDKSLIKRTIEQLKRLVGVAKPYSNLENKSKIIDEITVSQYNEHELTNLWKTNVASANISDVDGIFDYLKDLTDTKLSLRKRLDNLKFLVPEIDQIKNIYISSILSPNDMQTDSVSITVDTNNEKLDAEVSKLLNDFFNKDFKFGSKLHNWINDAAFDYGSKPIMLVPRDIVKRMSDEVTLAKEDLTPELEQLKNIQASFENFNLNTYVNDYSKIHSTAQIETDLDIAFEDLKNDLSKKTIDTLLKPEVIKKLAENNSSKFFTGKEISFTLDSSKIKTSEHYKKKADELTKLSGLDGYISGRSNKILHISENAELQEGDHPIVVELNPEFTVPVTLPGSKTEHLGYFVLLDHENRIISDATNYAFNSSDYSSSLTNANFNAVVGSGLSSQFIQKMSMAEKTKVLDVVFGITVKNMLQSQLSNLNLKDLNIGKYNAISNCMFHNLCRANKIKVLFVPEPLISYYTFKHNDDGSGKSLLEDVDFLLSLRTTLIVCSVLAMIRNSIDQKTATVELDEKNNDVEGTLEKLRNIILNKQIPKFNNNPYVLMRSLMLQSLKFIPKGIPGIENNLEIDVEHGSANYTAPDTELQEQLTSMFIMGLGLPKAIIDSLGENDFAIAIATSNLYFSNLIRTRHKQLETPNEKLVRNYIRLSKPLINRLTDLLSKFNNENNMETSIETIISCTSVNLPTPNISTDKAHYEELTDAMNIIEDLCEVYYSNDLLDGEDRELQDHLTSIRAHVKAQKVKELVTKLGFTSDMNMPSVIDLDIDYMTKFQDVILNIKKALTNRAKILQGKEIEDGGEKSGW